MKELSIEEKAKAYDEAIEKAKIWQEHLYDVNDKDYADELNYIFPELKKSEDERIRKGLLYVIEHHPTLPTEEAEEYVAWLEKQAEHANFRNKIQIGDKVTRNRDGVLVNLSQLNRVAKKDEKQGEQKPAWSEEDEYILGEVITHLEEYIILDKENYSGEDVEYYRRDIDWLKSLKERYTWKPSDEQMKALYEETQKSDRIRDERIVSLYEDLKKLK